MHDSFHLNYYCMFVVDTLLSKVVTFPLLIVALFFVVQKEVQPSPKPLVKKECEEHVEPVDKHFCWETTPPYPYRPYKPGPYKLKMDVVNIPAEEWLMIENTYKSRIEAKQAIIKEFYPNTIYAHNDSREAVVELYSKVLNFMKNRYPRYFYVDKNNNFHNTILNFHIPMDPQHQTTEDLICNLSRVVEEDFIVLLPDLSISQEEYVYKAGCFGFAAGFDPMERYNKPMTLVHGPVPTYKTNLRPAMNKFFDRLKPLVYVRRNNWSVQLHQKLFVMDSNKGSETEEIVAKRASELDFDKVLFRSERQCLTKLPNSGAMVFTIRTYLTPMSQIKQEGTGDRLVEAITQMQELVGHYKRRPEWGPAVVDYLSNGKVQFSGHT